MGRALLPQHDAGRRELPPQGPLWRAGGPAMLRVLILSLLWRGSLSQPPGFTLAVPQSVSVQEGLCVLIPCNFTYPASYDTDNPSDQLYRLWYKEPATVGQDRPVASSLPSAWVLQEIQGRFRLMGDPAHGDCSLQISDARRTDEGRYFLHIEKGMFEHTYRSNSDGTDPVLTISVPELTEEPEIQISPVQGLPGTLLAGEPVTVTCTAPGRCSGSPPQVTWMGPFNDTARNVSAQLTNGTWAHSSELSFTPGLGDNGKELVCTVTYSSAQGSSTSRTIQLHVGYPTGPPNTTGNLTRNGRPGHPAALVESEERTGRWSGNPLCPSLACRSGCSSATEEMTGLSQPDAPAMGRALLPRHDAGEWELQAQGPLWRAGGPATLRVLILALLWRGSLSQPPGFTLAVPQLVSVQEGLCVFVSCNFTYPASYDTDNPSAQLYGQWYKEPATVGQDIPVASSVPNPGVSQETQGRFRLTGDPALGDCSLQISDARQTDAGRYFFNIEKGMLDHTYRSNSDGTDPALTISVPELTEEPEIQISPARGLPGMLLTREPVTVTCTAPGRCSGSPPQVTWTGPFNDTARNVSAQLANGTWAHSSELSFTPGLGDDGKELVCTVTYSSAQGPSTSRTIQLHVGYPTGPPNITGTLTRNGRPDPTGLPNITGNLTSNGRPGSEDPDKPVFIGMACGLGVAIGSFLLGLCVIK
nr:sialic acid-binding Ig-like lectin 12 [Chrysemys picta bellii]